MSSDSRSQLYILLTGKSSLDLLQTGRMLNRIRSCSVDILPSVRATLRYISDTPPDLVITDYQLEDHTAVELLQAVKTRREWQEIPIIVCIDKFSSLLKTRVSNLGATSVLTKPLNQITMSRMLAELFPRRERQASGQLITNPDDIRAKLLQIRTLAPLSSLAKNILEIGRDPKSSAHNLAEEIKKDQSLTAKILQIVNSAFYGFHREIGNVDHAIVVMGFDEVIGVALAASLLQFYENGRNFLFDRDKFWLHSLGTAYIARALSRYSNGVIAKDAFVVGLLHDFGKVAMRQHFRDLFYKIIAEAARRKQPLHHVSLELANIEHGEIGALVAESWDLPEPLVKAIKHHHTPHLVRLEDKEVHLAHLANIFCHINQIGKSGNTVPDDPSPLSLKALGLEALTMEEIWASLKLDAELVRTALT
jgi:putative nucleotidyltransferase with HDIG domain